MALRLGKREAPNKDGPLGALADQIEKAKAGILTNVKHPFRVIKRQFEYAN
jgi:transposase, IS5 family